MNSYKIQDDVKSLVTDMAVTAPGRSAIGLTCAICKIQLKIHFASLQKVMKPYPGSVIELGGFPQIISYT